jgi:hypothetical protein
VHSVYHWFYHSSMWWGWGGSYISGAQYMFLGCNALDNLNLGC